MTVQSQPLNVEQGDRHCSIMEPNGEDRCQGTASYHLTMKCRDCGVVDHDECCSRCAADARCGEIVSLCHDADADVVEIRTLAVS